MVCKTEKLFSNKSSSRTRLPLLHIHYIILFPVGCKNYGANSSKLFFESKDWIGKRKHALNDYILNSTTPGTHALINYVIMMYSIISSRMDASTCDCFG